MRTEPDMFQDYDVVYIVEEIRTFIQDIPWIDRFGERLFMQYSEENPSYPINTDECYGWLVQFSDGNRREGFRQMRSGYTNDCILLFTR